MMIMMIINLILIGLSIVIITDFTDFSDTAKRFFCWVLTRGKVSTSDYVFHLLDCSLCQTFWLGVLYIIIMLIMGYISAKYLILWIFLCLLNAYLTNVYVLILQTVKNTFIYFLKKINDLIYDNKR